MKGEEDRGEVDPVKNMERTRRRALVLRILDYACRFSASYIA